MQSGKTGAGVELGEWRWRIKVTRKTLKFSSETFGQFRINYYFCTRKYETNTDREGSFVGSGRNEDH